MDLYLQEDYHRGGRQGKSELKSYRGSLLEKKIPNLVIADCHNLPFPNNSFDKVVCNELLEHKGINRPLLIKELLRVTQTFVEFVVPSIYHREQSPKNTPCHALTFRKKDIARLFKSYYYHVEQTRWRNLIRHIPIFQVPYYYKITVWK